MFNDLEYKQKTLDTKSSSFCGAKWYNATIWLGSGMTTSCHHPLPHKIDENLVKSNPKLLHNTPEKKEQRRQMQCGERPKGCEYCWKIEDMGKDYISDRVYKSKIYTDKELEDAFRTDYMADINLRTLEIAFDRTCNFACSYCNPAFSTTWVKDIKSNGPYQELISDGRNHFTHVHDSNQLFKFGEHNPYVEAFFKWWESDLHKTLTELRITGGEPTMSPELWRLVDWFEKNANKSKCGLAINSNLGAKDELIDKLVQASSLLPKLDVYTSNESMLEHSNYIRDGIEYKKWYDNLIKVHKAGIQTHIMCTINGLCLLSLPDFIYSVLQMRTLYGPNFGNMSFNILRFPSFQSPLVMPTKVKTKAIELLQFVLKYPVRNHTRGLTEYEGTLHDWERDQIARLIEYLRSVEKPHSESFDMPKLHNDFKKFYQQYDIRRNKNFVKTFPELEEWYELL